MMIDAQKIKLILPQAFPFIMIDSVTEYEKGKMLTAVKNLTANEWPVTGYMGGKLHFPENLLIEAAAQAALILYYVTMVHEGKSPLFYLGKVSAEFKCPVLIGDQLTLDVQSGKIMKLNGFADVSVSTERDLAAEIRVFYGIKDAGLSNQEGNTINTVKSQ